MNQWVVTDENPISFSLSLDTDKNNHGEAISQYLSTTRISFQPVQDNWSISTMDSPPFDDPHDAMEYVSEQLDIDAFCNYRECIRTIFENNLSRMRSCLLDMDITHAMVLSNLISIGSLIDRDNKFVPFFRRMMKWSKGNKEETDYFRDKLSEFLNDIDSLIDEGDGR